MILGVQAASLLVSAACRDTLSGMIATRNVAGKLPATAGWQPALPRVETRCFDFAFCDNPTHGNERNRFANRAPAVVPPVVNRADHDWSCCWRRDWLAPARLGQQGLFSTRHLYQPDQVD